MPTKRQKRSREFYKSLPKVELHRHLEGSLRLSTMIDIARTYKLDLPYDDELKFSSMVQVVDTDPFNFQNFLSKFATLRKFYQSPEVIRRIARETIIDAAVDNIRYLELRFTPVALTRVKDFPMKEAIDWVIEEVNTASIEFGVMTKLIASVNRHESVKLAEEVMHLAVDRIGKGIVGLDLAGSEAEFSGEDFESVFNQAKESGLKITIHAGEWGGPEIIKLAIETLSAERIGHGVRVMEDARVIDLAKDRRVAFEVCPTSNFQSGVVTSLNKHPLPEMISSGLICIINTDDPGISRIELSDEYQISCELLGVSENELSHLIQNAIDASFLPENDKTRLTEKIVHELSEIYKE